MMPPQNFTTIESINANTREELKDPFLEEDQDLINTIHKQE